MGSVPRPGQSTRRVGTKKCSNSVTLLYIHKCDIKNLHAVGDAGISKAITKRTVFCMHYLMF
jgi:hypothetical protein